MDAALTIREGCIADGAEVARVFGAAFAQLDFLPKLYTSDEDRAYFTAQLSSARALVAEQGAAIVGFAVYVEHRLNHLYVDPMCQGRGIGSALLARVKLALPAGFDLWTFQQNRGARRFYERHGFRCVEQTDGSRNEERVPDVRYEWRAAGRSR